MFRKIEDLVGIVNELLELEEEDYKTALLEEAYDLIVELERQIETTFNN